MKSLCITLSFLITVFALQAQEINCKITVNADQVQDVSPTLYPDMQRAMNEFVNNNKWTDDVFKENERIELEILITVSKKTNNVHTAEALIQAARPVYGSSYNSSLLRILDKDFVFEYQEFQPIEYNENSYISHLSSLMSFYVYYVLGLDYDSFSPNGGKKYYEKAQNILNSVPAGNGEGWKPFDGNQTRYWLITDMMKLDFETYRQAMYNYHIRGLDVMSKDPERGRKAVLAAIESVQKVHRNNASSYLLLSFALAKKDEIIGIFTPAPQEEREKVYEIMVRIDPNNADDYDKMKKGKG